jgi:hypothetical protein
MKASAVKLQPLTLQPRNFVYCRQYSNMTLSGENKKRQLMQSFLDVIVSLFFQPALGKRYVFPFQLSLQVE